MRKNRKEQETRIGAEFAELVAIDSVSFQEREMTNRLTEKLREIGFEVQEDNAGRLIGGAAGNLYACLRGTIPGPPVLLSAHMDTVTPGIGKRAVFHADGTVTSAGDTVLGGDDLTGIIAILEGIRMTRAAGLPHRDLEVVFCVAEEVYTKGSSAFDCTRIRAREGYTLDVSGAVGKAVLQAPTILSFTATVKGRAAHAGFEPEKGIHAIQIVSRAVAALSMGHTDAETTRNIGVISGGSVVNAVPEICSCQGEIRSYRHESAVALLRETERVFADAVQGTDAALEFSSQTHTKAFRLPPDFTPAKHFQAACEKLGIPVEFASSFGGSDANTFNANGIPCAVLSCGMYQVHTVREYASVPEICKGAELVSLLIQMEYDE